jgi:peptidoglycan/xylan/chitin deacetylase (PgdA/CDA1 family)
VTPPRRGIVVLCYHGVEHDVARPEVQPTHLRFADFERHIRFLAGIMPIIGVDDLPHLIEQGRLDGPAAVLTFDDGYRNTREIVAPFLVNLGIPFAVFVSTRHIAAAERFPTFTVRAAFTATDRTAVTLSAIGRSFDLSAPARRAAAHDEVCRALKRLPQPAVQALLAEIEGLLPAGRWDEIRARFRSAGPMTWDEVRALHRLGAVIGAHGHDHAILHDRQTDDFVDEQVGRSKALLEAQVAPCRYFAYPNGGVADVTRTACRAVRRHGYALGFAAVPGVIDERADRYALPRLFPNADLAIFERQLRDAPGRTRQYAAWAAPLAR